jgi:hypothetical protein
MLASERAEADTAHNDATIEQANDPSTTRFTDRF